MKRKKTLYIIFMAIVSLSCFCAALVAPILAKFATETTAPQEGGDITLDYTVSNKFEVNSQEELFAAINQGYTYIQLDKDIENPLIVTQNQATDLNSDLILDLNGIEIQRNGSNPILNINPGVRLTVTDTSADQSGGLYNPVGSVFNINGGTLTVTTGTFESGPRYSEYYSYNTEVLKDTDTTVNGTTVHTDRTVVSSVNPVNYYTKSGNTVTSQGQKNMPIIKSYPEQKANGVYIHGNLYFDKVYEESEIDIAADTYCYYRSSQDGSLVADQFVSADWYYTYYVDENNAYFGTQSTNQEHNMITIYGYNNVIGKAKEQTEISNYYAAIQMQSGNLDVQEAEFCSYFGVDKTACVNALGGTITVREGNFSSRIPNATATGEKNVIYKGDDEAAFGTEYFDIFNWNTNATNSAQGGKSYCIMNSGNATVRIDKGNFYSTNNNLIKMTEGTLTIGNSEKKSTFTKQAINTSSASNNNAAIYMESGNIAIENSDFTVYGNYSYGVYSEAGNITLETADFTLNNAYSYGILSDNGNITMESSNFIGNGDYSYGIFSNGGSVSLTGGSITLDSNASSHGVYASSDVTLTNTTVNVGYNSSQGRSGTVNACIGVYAASGDVTLNATSVFSYEIGVAVNGGKLDVTGTGAIQTNKASAAVVAGGSLTFDENAVYKITSYNTTSESANNTYNLNLPFKTSNADNLYNNTDGIYVSGGAFESNGSLTLTHKGLYNDVSKYTHYNNLTITSYAVRVVGGSVSLIPNDTSKKVSITANVGGGVYCSSGNITLGNEGFSGETVNSYVTVETTGKDTSGRVHGVGSEKGQGWNIPKSLTGGPAIELNGGNITVNNGTYTAAFGDGVLAKIPYSTNTTNAKIQIENGYFEGAMGGATGYSGPASSYGVKVIGGAKVYINGGEFYGTAGGASVTGISNFTSTSNYNGNYAEVYVSAGTFAKSTNTDGFMIFDMAKVALGSYSLKNSESDNQNIINTSAIVINSDLCPISINKIGDNAITSYIYVYYGTYNGGQAELWNESNYAYVKVYNTNTTGLVRTKFEDTNTTGGHPYDTQFEHLTDYYSGISGVRGVKYTNLTALQTFEQSIFENLTGY